MNNLILFNFSFCDNLRERAKKNEGVIAQTLDAVANALDDTLVDVAEMHDMAKDMHNARKEFKQ
jgi:hypothetical protein